MKFLEQNKWYKQYLTHVVEGKLVLPSYEKNDQGEIIIHTGERFCRVEDCSRGKHVYDTQNLRAHVKTHKIPVAPNQRPKGRHSTAEQDAITAWFKNLFAPVMKDKLRFFKNGKIDYKEIKKDLIAKHVTEFPCEWCGKQRNTRCLSDPRCDYLRRYYDVQADFPNPQNWQRAEEREPEISATSEAVMPGRLEDKA